jgi:hypothetical protein
MTRRLLAMGLLLAGLVGCRQGRGQEQNEVEGDSSGLMAREAKLAEALASADTGEKKGTPVARWLMPPELSEISGLALTPDGRLFAHNDEAARVTQLDYRRGTIVKQFFIGRQGLRADFEGITWANDRFYLLGSDGTLYEFREGSDGERVDYTAHDTRLGKECEFEGVTFDSTANALLLACKNVGLKDLRGSLVIYRYSLADSGGSRISELKVPLADVIGKNGWRQIRPTDITIDPFTGNYVMVAAQEKAILSITPAGAVVFARPLGGRHPQSEGVAITRDSILIISDESIAQPGSITLYKWP